MFDVLIIGAGPAGLSAALWSDELGLKTLLLEESTEIGGQLLRVYNRIDNYLGQRVQNGLELRNVFAEHIKEARFTLRTNTHIRTVDLIAKHIELENGESLRAKAIIIATGVRRRRLGIPGELELAGEGGVVESGNRDRDFLSGKDLCIVGGGDAALENALMLAEVCPNITLVHRSREFRARREFIDRIKLNDRIKVFTQARLARIIGESKVEAVEIIKEGSADPFIVRVGGVLIRIGVQPNTELFKNQIELDKDGYIKVSSEQETSIKDVFAIGDVSNPIAPTISGAVGSGATAAKIISSRQ
jgi:thioredoxin reductase (NADPH)